MKDIRFQWYFGCIPVCRRESGVYHVCPHCRRPITRIHHRLITAEEEEEVRTNVELSTTRDALREREHDIARRTPKRRLFNQEVKDIQVPSYLPDLDKLREEHEDIEQREEELRTKDRENQEKWMWA